MTIAFQSTTLTLSGVQIGTLSSAPVTFSVPAPGAGKVLVPAHCVAQYRGIAPFQNKARIAVGYKTAEFINQRWPLVSNALVDFNAPSGFYEMIWFAPAIPPLDAEPLNWDCANLPLEVMAMENVDPGVGDGKLRLDLIYYVLPLLT